MEVETIFDHGITEKELDDFYSDPDDLCRTREGYIEFMLDGESPDINYDYDVIKWHISRLYWDRGNMEKTYHYTNQIKNPQYKQDSLNLLGGF